MRAPPVHVAVVALGAMSLMFVTSCDSEREPVADPAESSTAAGSAPAAGQPGEQVSGEEVSREEVSGDVSAAASDWCAAAQSVRDASLATDVIDPTDPQAVEAALAEMVERAESAVAVAPDEIVADVQASLDAVRRFDAALAEADYDVLQADLDDVVAEGGSEEADARIEAYNAEFCGFGEVETADAATETASGPDLSDGTIREQTVALFVEQGFTEEEAACLFDNIDLDDPTLASDQARMLELVETCDLDIQRLAGLGG